MTETDGHIKEVSTRVFEWMDRPKGGTPTGDD